MGIEKLNKFKISLKESLIVNTWSSPDNLAANALAALAQTRNMHEGIGWIRGDQAAKTDILNQINDLRKENAELKQKLAQEKPSEIFADMNLAGLDEEFEIRASMDVYTSYGRDEIDLSFKASWRYILAAIGSKFRTSSNTSGLDNGLIRLCCKIKNSDHPDKISINNEDKDRGVRAGAADTHTPQTC